ncbi:MAG TPA: OB-fold domain-containing protein [Actinomycetota bacterium]
MRPATLARVPHTLTDLVMGTAPTVVDETRPYWEGTLVEELRVQVCNECGHVQLPGGPCCAECLSQDLAWRAASGMGTVFSFTIVRHAFHPSFTEAVPYVLADVELAEGPIIPSNITECAPEDVRVGMPVEVWFDEEIEDAFHTKLRLPKFRPRS